MPALRIVLSAALSAALLACAADGETPLGQEEAATTVCAAGATVEGIDV
jgi:ABC-type molybdate transport system substrate-binding protein